MDRALQLRKHIDRLMCIIEPTVYMYHLHPSLKDPILFQQVPTVDGKEEPCSAFSGLLSVPRKSRTCFNTSLGFST